MDKIQGDHYLYQILKPLLCKSDYMPYEIEKDNKNILKKTLKNLDNFYENNYKNNYYIAFQLISGILQNHENDPEILDTILSDLKKYSENIQLKNINQIDKLIDYLFLELARYNTFNESINNANERAENLQQLYADYWQQNNNLQEQIDDAKSKTDDMIGKSVSILGIFTGVVMTFSGGMSLFSNAFSSLSSEVSKYRLFGICSLIGFILYNIIVILLFVIARISGKDIGISCKQNSCYNCTDCNIFNKKRKFTKNMICQIINKYPHIFIGEWLFLYIIYFIFFLWFFSKNSIDFIPCISSSISKNPIIHDLLLIFILLLPFLLTALFFKISFKKK